MFASKRRLQTIPLVAALILVALATCALSRQSQPCDDCGGSQADWTFEDPFHMWQSIFNPYTLGLPVGVEAPTSDSFELLARRTLVIVFHQDHDPSDYHYLAAWGEMDGLQLVCALIGSLPSHLAPMSQLLSDDTALLGEPEASIVAATYQVGGSGVGSVAFLVNEDQQVVYRSRNHLRELAIDDDAMLRHFVGTGEVPAGTHIQHVLWYGDTAPWPDFAMQSIDQDPVTLPQDGRVKLFYCGAPLAGEKGRLVHSELDALAREFPSVDFYWILWCHSDEALQSMWELGQRLGLYEMQPDFALLSEADFVAQGSTYREELIQVFRSDLQVAGTRWTGLLDFDLRLTRFWGIVGLPSVMIMDGDGEVLFPSTIFPVRTVGGTPKIHPGALDELRRILDGGVSVE